MLHKNDHVRPAHKDDTVDKLVPTLISECSLVATGQGVCSTMEITQHIQGALESLYDDFADNVGPLVRSENSKVGSARDAQVMQTAKKVTKCETEKCVLLTLEKPLVESAGRAAFDGNLINNFKVDGPLDNTWLSNVHIDSVMKQFQSMFPRFSPYNFNMRNYMDWSYKNGVLLNQPDTLATISFCSLYKQGFDCAACIVNNDRYQNGGTHWMAIFIDARCPPRATCEFFNSAGNDPIPEFVSFLVKSANCIRELPSPAGGKPWKADIIKVSRRRHQQSTTECGVYSLFYVWARLNGVPYSYFLDKPVDDQLMFEFRQHLFTNGESSSTGKKFDWAEFTKRVNVTWERDT